MQGVFRDILRSMGGTLAKDHGAEANVIKGIGLIPAGTLPSGVPEIG